MCVAILFEYTTLVCIVLTKNDNYFNLYTKEQPPFGGGE
jgi:hypothetical protein